MTDEYFMMLAMKEAKRAFEEDEVPVGAIVVLNEKLIARGHNMVEKLNDPTAHAEMIALTSAFNNLGGKYLPEATLYITVEPCLMCAGPIVFYGVPEIIVGASWPGHEVSRAFLELHGVTVTLLELEECRQLLL